MNMTYLTVCEVPRKGRDDGHQTLESNGCTAQLSDHIRTLHVVIMIACMRIIGHM